MDTLAAATVEQYPDYVRVFDTRRPGLWLLFEVTSRGVRLVQASCTQAARMESQARLLAGLCV